MKKWAMIATWRMAVEGVTLGADILKNGGKCQDAVERAIMEVEDYPFYKSVGYGGLPNEVCEVELDAAFMDGKTLSIGAVAGIKDYKNPVCIARKLSADRFNIFLVGEGAEAYAQKNGFVRQNMLTERAKKTWELRMKEITEKNLSPYDGHDTVCMIGIDSEKDMAAATGLGEDIMKGCLSYETVQRMKRGMSPSEAAQSAVADFSEQLKRRRGHAGAISVIAMNNKGEWGIGTNVEFSFVAADPDNEPKVYLANPVEGSNEVKIEIASKEYMEAYKKNIQKPLEEI